MSTKAPDALRTIGEVSEMLDIPTHVLRFWEGKFKKQIVPTKCNGRRLYSPEAIENIRQIKALLYTKGLTIKGAQRHFQIEPTCSEDHSLFALTSSVSEEDAHKTLAQNTIERHDVDRLSQIYRDLQITQERLRSLNDLFVLANVGA